MLKEWEQLSVELVMDGDKPATERASKTLTKSCTEISLSNAASYACLKKSSIDCLNARFLEEQKIMKFAKTMQSVNMKQEAQNSIQEQQLLSTYGDWDSADIHSFTAPSGHSPACHSKCNSVSTSTQVDMLLHSNSAKMKPHHHDDEEYDPVEDSNDDDDEDEDDEDECDDEDDEEYECEDEEEEEDTDGDDESVCSSDRSSTTSTSTSNNQKENGRVCDCCYCMYSSFD